MWLRRLEADRLRNLRGIDLSLPAGMTLLQGRNGQGKTSLLEAIYLLATGRSFRSRRLEESIAWDGGPAKVSGEIEARAGTTRMAVYLDRGERQLLVEGAPREMDAYLGRLDLVDLTAPRMDVLKGPPEERRRFLDRGVVGMQPALLTAFGEARRALQQRNALLRSSGGRLSQSLRTQLDAWDERFAVAAARVHAERRAYAVRLAARLGAIGRRIFPDDAVLELHYRPSPREAGEHEASEFSRIVLEALAAARERDAALGFTGFGPHRDEMKVTLDGVDLRKFGSAGQQRAAMIGLKLAKLDLLQEARGETPIFLMDDFDTDIDEERARRLTGYLTERELQVIAATSKDSLVERLDVPFERIRVRDGGIVG